MLAGTPQDCAHGVSLQAAAFTRKPTSAAVVCVMCYAPYRSSIVAQVGLFGIPLRFGECLIGSLLTAFPKRIRLALVVEYIGVCAALQPQFDNRRKPNARQVVGQRLWLSGTHSRTSITCYLAYASPPIDIAKGCITVEALTVVSHG